MGHRPGIRLYLALLVVAAFLPVAGLATAVFVLSLRSDYEMAWQRAESRAVFLAAAVHTQMDTLAGTLDVLSASPDLQAGNLAAFHTQARTITGERLDAVSLVRPDGLTLLNSRMPPGKPTPAFSVPQDEVWRALDQNRTIVTAIFQGATSKRPIFAMIKPVMVQGRPHALAVGMFASRFDPLLSWAEAPWTIALLDNTAAQVATFPENSGIAALHAPLAEALGDETSDRVHLKLGPTGAQVEHMTALQTIHDTGWVALAAFPAEAIEAPARRHALLYGLGALALAVPGVMLALWLGMRLARSMGAMAQFATAMGAEPPPTDLHLPTLKGACHELDVVAAQLERAACDIAARDAQVRQQRDLAEENAIRVARKSDELARSNAELEQFAYVASHDLREPLRMVSSFLTLLERRQGDKLDDEAREFLDFARDGALRMDRMILDLLQYSRVGRQETAAEIVDLGHVVSLAAEELSTTMAEAGAQLHVDTPLPQVMGCPGELERLFLNLIGNAIKYRSPDRAPAVDVTASPTAEGWRLTVADNGIGIAPDFHDQIFALFKRLHSRDSYGGNGIGLAICKKIVEHHGGRIWVECRPQGGSAFHFILPSAQAASG